jgi:hypothetical protein
MSNNLRGKSTDLMRTQLRYIENILEHVADDKDVDKFTLTKCLLLLNEISDELRGSLLVEVEIQRSSHSGWNRGYQE